MTQDVIMLDLEGYAVGFYVTVGSKYGVDDVDSLVPSGRQKHAELTGYH